MAERPPRAGRRADGRDPHGARARPPPLHLVLRPLTALVPWERGHEASPCAPQALARAGDGGAGRTAAWARERGGRPPCTVRGVGRLGAVSTPPGAGPAPLPGCAQSHAAAWTPDRVRLEPSEELGHQAHGDPGEVTAVSVGRRSRRPEGPCCPGKGRRAGKWTLLAVAADHGVDAPFKTPVSMPHANTSASACTPGRMASMGGAWCVVASEAPPALLAPTRLTRHRAGAAGGGWTVAPGSPAAGTPHSPPSSTEAEPLRVGQAERACACAPV